MVTKNKLPDPEQSPRPAKAEEKDENKDLQTDEIQLKPKHTGLIKIEEDPDRGKIRIFRFKLIVASCSKNESFKKGEIIISKAEHTHFFRTQDTRTGVRHERSTPACGHSHPITIEYIKDKKTNKVVGIDLDKCEVGPAIKEIVVGSENSRNKYKEWTAVKLGEKTYSNKETKFQKKTVEVYDEHKHILDYVDYEDAIIQAARV